VSDEKLTGLRAWLPPEQPESSLPATPSGRLEFVRNLMCPTDEDGEPLEPLLTEEQALKMLTAPLPPFGVNRSAAPSLPIGRPITRWMRARWWLGERIRRAAAWVEPSW